MSIKVNISRYFFGDWANESVVAEVSGNTVGQCLNYLARQFPAIKEQLFEGNGEVAVGVRIFINGESAFPEELVKPVRDGDVIDIIPMAISGG
ncbi:MAG TPA: MoaD/ThiS family protein [Dehalococcoidia bacterium]|nr:MoaD/ThiS family protein [Dehalococcoidia bacterium]